jgi:hypothetical protein
MVKCSVELCGAGGLVVSVLALIGSRTGCKPEAGRRAEALAHAQEAATFYRELTAESPAAFAEKLENAEHLLQSLRRENDHGVSTHAGVARAPFWPRGVTYFLRRITSR